HGVEQIEALGQKFDPSIHEAMMQKVAPDKEQNTVLEEFQKGYKLNSRVIRPSKVIVNKPSTQGPLEQQGEEESGTNTQKNQKETSSEKNTE
ncbi:MAG: nucleotide exchange factor GrpE, partial [Planctomycetota bacterium]